MTWLDEAGAPIRKDSDGRMKWNSPCDATLTVKFQSSGQRTFTCQVTTGGEVQASVELRVTVPGGWSMNLMYFLLFS